MKKKILYFISLTLFLFSCTGEEKEIFSQSAATRMTEAIDNARELLVSAENGWVMEYFPNEDSRGTNLLMKFEKDGKVTVATKNDAFRTYTSDESAFDVIGDNGPVLTFNTYNSVLHYYSDPEKDGLGKEGDYEFIIMDTAENLITLKGKKRGVFITLKRFSADKEWENYLDNIIELENFIIQNAFSYSLTSENSSYILYSEYTGILSLVKEGESDPEYYPYLVNENGLVFVKPLELNEGNFREFVLNDQKDALISEDGNAVAYIKGRKALDVYIDILTPQLSTTITKEWRIVSQEMGPKVKAIYERMEASCDSIDRVLNVAFNYYGPRTSEVFKIMAAKTGSVINGYLDLITTVENDEVNYEFLGEGDDAGLRFYSSFAGFAEFMEMLNAHSFVVERNEPFNSSTLKLKSKDEGVWFNIKYN